MYTSDDEAPEEIALSTGRNQAATLRSQEQAQRKQQSLLKRKRKRNDVPELIQQAETPFVRDVTEDEPQLDCVPDEVIEALTAADRYKTSIQKCQQTTQIVKFHCIVAGSTAHSANTSQLLIGLAPSLRLQTLQTYGSFQQHNLSLRQGSSCPSAEQAQLLSKCSVALIRLQHRQVNVLITQKPVIGLASMLVNLSILISRSQIEGFIPSGTCISLVRAALGLKTVSAKLFSCICFCCRVGSSVC